MSWKPSASEPGGIAERADLLRLEAHDDVGRVHLADDQDPRRALAAVDHLVGPGLADRERDDLALVERPLAVGGPQRQLPPSTISISSLPKW